MPSLHFATALVAAMALAETGSVAGAMGWGYALTLGFALLYLGEHYLTDLAAGALLAVAVRRGGAASAPLCRYCHS
jgi:membrane-associated phospholipid phosphatase